MDYIDWETMSHEDFVREYTAARGEKARRSLQLDALDDEGEVSAPSPRARRVIGGGNGNARKNAAAVTAAALIIGSGVRDEDAS